MKTYYICAAIVFTMAYAIFHFAFSAGGDGQLYRINDRIAFELREPNEYTNGVTVHGYKQTGKTVCFMCGDYERDDSDVWMANARYRSGDWVFTNFPQHEQAKTDIVNLRTGEAIIAEIPADFKYGDDLSKLPEYETRGLVKTDANKLTQDYIEANFQPLSTYTSRCAGINFWFVVAGLLLAFPKLILVIIEMIIESTDPFNPSNIYGNHN